MPVVAARYVYGGAAYGTLPYGGDQPATIIPTRDVDGIIFLTSNDRYQVVSCSYGGAVSTPPEFRYWYAAPAPWAEMVNEVNFVPPFFSLDEDALVPAASLELPFRRSNAGQEMLVKGVIVEFVPRPYATNESGVIDTGTNVGFSIHLEGQGVIDYTKMGGDSKTSGMVQSATQTFTSTVLEHSSDPWPNVRSLYMQVRMPERVRAVRAVLSDIELCAIVNVSILGDHVPGRQA